MRTFVWILRLLVFLLLLIFAINNRHLVTIYWMLGAQWQGPMVLVVFAAFACGSLFGILAMLPRWWRQRQRARAMTRAEPAAPPPAPEPTLPPMTHPPREML